MDLRRPIVVLLAVFLLLGGAAVAADNLIPVDGDIPMSAGESPLITLETEDADELAINDFFDGDELDIQTPDGDMRIGGNDSASARLAASDIEGDQTQLTDIEAGTAWLELNPADKQRVDVRGDVDGVAFRAVEPDNDQTDIQLNGTEGGTAELAIYDLEPGETYAAYDGEILGVLEADGDGVATGEVSMPDGSQAIELRSTDAFDEPTLSDPVPTGDVTERPEELQVFATVDAAPATVEFEHDGDDLGEVEINSNGNVSVDLEVEDLGAFDWSATITDDLGQTDTITASYQTPDIIEFREEHDQTQPIEEGDVEVRFFSARGDIAITREITDDGVVSLEGLPDTDFVVFADGPDHYSRTIYTESIFEQDTMFLLNETEVPQDDSSAVRSRFIYEDLTGNFPQEDTTIQIERAVDTDGDGDSEFQTIAGDFWGASGEFEQQLERGVRYRLVLTNRETGAETIAGTHIPTEELSQTVRTSGVIEEAQQGSGVTPIARLDGESIELGYNDPSDETESLDITVESQSGDEVLLDESVDGPLGTYGQTIELNESQLESDWIVTFDGGDRHRSAVPVGGGAVTLPINMPGWLLTFLGTIAVTFVGALYGPRTALLGSWAMVFVAAGLAMFGWAFSGTSVLVAALVATGVTFADRIRP